MSLPAKKKTPIKISIRQYIDNPYRGSAFLASRKAIKSGLNLTFIKLLNTYRTQFFAVPYIYINGDILFHIRVPSEDFRSNKLYYDVLFKIENDPTQRYSMRNVRMFSNSPSFIFTYAYVYYHDDLVIDEFASKLPMQALTQPPVIRNPVESLGYEKTTYIAARYLLDGFCLTDAYINKFGKKMNALEERNLLIQIADPDKIVQIYALAKHEKAKNPRKIDKARDQKRKELRQEFIQNAKRNRPKSVGGVINKKAPRAKITARKAKRNLGN
jgi:hypothetical protein